MKKREDWPEKMNEYIERIATMPFAWGTLDCCMFAADCVLAMTDEDFAADFRGQYTDAPSAYVALQRFAGGGIPETMAILADRFGWEPVEPLRAQRGDIVLIPPHLCHGDPRFGGALGICVGPLSIFMAEIGARAISTIPSPGQDGIEKVWRVPLGTN
jgi:hypothetical protein